MPPFLHILIWEPARPNVEAPVHVRREVPKLDGSQGGFIALVVALSIIIVISCTAVFFLLRNHEPTEQERTIRRERSHRYREEPEFSTTVPLREKIGNMFSFWNKKGVGRGLYSRRPTGRGWVQTGSGDEWEPESDHEDDAEIAPYPGRRTHHFGNDDSSPSSDHRMVDSPFRSPPSDSGLHPYITGSYVDPFSKESPRPNFSPTESDIDRSRSPALSSPGSLSASHVTSAVLHESSLEDGIHHNQRQFTAQSGTSVRTFEGGTKFIESL
ncbi:hypothetical protein SERLA73DRAFT_185993 [Serpula lacrymans var. lacrymans S7.3]|uniref:Uncharacterized protein n=2 Tax=Serpula lacrymans var. lacrymans TaxID=341189 RepID=F8Q6R7_SERL3|nr:uncharacterized protein SERLADRAFT_474806 [Serpula lacrymans var. lacrymans S7.9]EGN96305.1 hypothetical protein SERLA73DRAFT_185993 [Serpula lacrymans var. lacrymans S7.3]EGO21840.1 hypothetical protein SERLADRAFT_474806 [Serpula lacrymans var. lacrymans S7.9]